MGLKNVSERRLIASLIGFVALATIFPAIVIPIGFVVVAASAFGPPRIQLRGSVRGARWLISRAANPVALAAGVTMLMIIAVAVPAAASSLSPTPDNGVGIAKLRVYPEGESGDPAVDPSYVEADPDPWIEDSWIIEVSGNVASFGLNITNRHSAQAYDVFLRIAVNDLALFEEITVTVSMNGDAAHQGDSATFMDPAFAVGTPTLKNGASWPSHGVYPTAFTSFDVGGIGRLGSSNDTVVLSISVEGAFTDGLLVHFDADGWTVLLNQGRSPILSDDPNDSNIRNPNSADTTVRIPTVSSVVLPAAAAGLLYVVAARRKRKRA